MKLTFKVQYDCPRLDKFANHTDEEKEVLVFSELLRRVKSNEPDHPDKVIVSLIRPKPARRSRK